MTQRLTLSEIVVLFEELNGRLLNRETGERSKGILAHKLSIRAKYLLNNELNKAVAEEVKFFEEARMDIFKELGTLEGDSYIVAPENQAELIKKIQELEAIEKDIEVPKLNVGELFNIETDDYFPILLEKVLAKEKIEATILPLEDEK
jgi:hypothetical protein